MQDHSGIKGNQFTLIEQPQIECWYNKANNHYMFYIVLLTSILYNSIVCSNKKTWNLSLYIYTIKKSSHF